MGCTSECFQDFGKFLDLKMSRNNLEKTGDSSDAHSRRTRGGIPSEPYALVTSSFDRMQWTLRVENIGKGIGLALMTFKCRHNLSPEYLQSSINERQQTRTLRSNSRQPLLIQRVTTNMGGRSFLHAAPTVWNNLPVSLTQITNINTFKKQLKTYLFEKVYN